ncbi:hypothetical protein A1Q1_04147 [Trichosporon asahii var. asahii CBS 2479]|uniref:Uncharacterized protein n=1 Tax=Trichosporon asahii var. asahii (strain ATCC 90039 / CBS 2479 / JCM 2466 / KCTC 7840 / NBRC 103889/ NCYC 2677 / UAMH 7654) TaxID=1186058 RepID=J6ERL5_TRIAS|nr:hypothetical protein A1Q1_04147 [Trichosporon asahii var. asahii CBS 2479]EJT47154.1 hypothetical protein A1Q1_04147 [Trichosporon asahii var. asahii CBS 2479]
MVRDVRGPSLAHSPSFGVLLERKSLPNDSVAGPGPSSRPMSRSKAGSSSKATPRTSTMPSGRKLANLLSSEANDTPVVTKARRYRQSTPTMMRADETMLYDIAPPPDMPSSSLFGDESDDDTATSPRSAKGNAVMGRGNLLTPVNSTLFTAPPPPARLSASRSARLPSPESMPQAVNPANLKASQSQKRTSTPKPSSSQRSRASIAPADAQGSAVATPIASQSKLSQPPSVSSRRQPATPNASRHATPPRPLVAETAYFRRTLTPIARKALKGKVVGCMEKPIHFEGEDPLLLEPELRHRSGSMTPGSVARTKRTPKTAPAGRKSRTKLKAPPATSVAQRLFVRPDEDSAPNAESTPDEDSDDDEAGNDTFVDIKKRRQPPQRSALGSHPPLNASDLKSSDTVGEEDATPKRPSPLIDLGRFVQSNSGQETAAVTTYDDEMPLEEAWNEPLFLAGSPDSSIGSPLPQSRDPSPVRATEKEEPVSPARSLSAPESPPFPPSSPPREPSPVASQRSSPALHAPTPTLGISSPMRPPPSSPAVIASPAFPPSPALRAPTPGGPNPSPMKARESLRKSAQVRSHAGKRLSESLRSPSVDPSEIPNGKEAQQSRPSSSRLQSPFAGAQAEERVGSPKQSMKNHDRGNSSDESEDDFNLEGDTVIVADGEDSLELQDTYVNTQEADAMSPPRLSSEPPPELPVPSEPTHDVVDGDAPQSRGPGASPTSSTKTKNTKRKARKSDGSPVTLGSAPVSPSSSKKSLRKSCNTRPVQAEDDGASHGASDAEPEQSTREESRLSAREGTAEDPLLLEPAPRSASKMPATRSRQSWLDSVRARSNTPASPLAEKKSGEPVSSLDHFLALDPAPEPQASHLAPPQPSPRPSLQPSPQSGKHQGATADIPRPRFSMSPSMTRAWRPQGDSEASSRASPPLIHPVEAVHGVEVGLEDTVALPSLNVSNAGDQSPGAGAPFDFSVDGPFSDNDDSEAEDAAIVQVEHRELSIQVQDEAGLEASFDLSADTVREVDLSADTVREIDIDDEASGGSNPTPEEDGQELDEQAEHAGSEPAKSQSRSPYVADDSPLADVVNAALDAGMVIDSDAQGTEAVNVELERQEASPAPSTPAEDSSEAESDDIPLMPSRLRRSLHAGATPMRPKILSAKVAPPSPPRDDRPVTPVRAPRPRVLESAGRTPSMVPGPPSAVASSPFVRDYSSPFMVKPSASPTSSAAKSSGGRSTRMQPEIVVEPSSPLVSPPSVTPKSTHTRATHSIAQDAGVVIPRRDVEPQGQTATSSHRQPPSPPSVLPTSTERAVRPLPIRKSVAPTPTRPARVSATPIREPVSVERTVSTPIIAPTPRAIKPLPHRGMSVTPRAPQQQHDAPQSGPHLHSQPSSRASSRARSRSPLRNFSPKAIGTATAIAATALAVAVPAAASPSPATIRAQLSPEPELSPLAHSAVSSQRPGHPHLDTYRSPPRSSRSSRLSATPSAHSTQSERSRSPYEHQDHSDHASIANSRLAFALAGLSDEEDDYLPEPPVISVTPFFSRSYDRAPSAASQSSPAATPKHNPTAAAQTNFGTQRTPSVTGASKEATPTPRPEIKLTTPRPLAKEGAAKGTPLARDQPAPTTPHLRVESQSNSVTPLPRARAATHTPQSSVKGKTPASATTPASSVKATPQTKASTPRSSTKATASAPQSSHKTPTTPAPATVAPTRTPLSSVNASARLSEARTPQQVSTANLQEAEEDRDIGADDTVVHDIGADDTIDGGSAWDLTAADLTYDAGMTAFDAHAFKGADWDVTRIERVPRGASEDHRLQDIDEASEEDTASQPKEDSPPTAAASLLAEESPIKEPPAKAPPVEEPLAEVAFAKESSAVEPPAEEPSSQESLMEEELPAEEPPAMESPARPSTPPRAPSVPKSPVRQSPRLAARRRAQTQTQSPASKPKPKSTRVNARSPVTPQAPSQPAARTPSPSRETAEQSVVPTEPAAEEREDADAAAQKAEQPVASNRKVTLKVVARIVKVESDSEDEEITEVIETSEQEQTEEDPPASSELSPERTQEANRQIKSAAPAPPTPPPAPPLPETVSTSSSETRVESTLSAREQPAASANTESSRASLSQAKGKTTQTKSIPAGSKIPLATGGRSQPPVRPEASSSTRAEPAALTPVQPTPVASTSADKGASRPVQKPETPIGRTPAEVSGIGRTPTSFVKEQSRQIEQALGRRPAVPSKLSKQVIPSSSPAESPVAERTYSRPQSRASHEGPTSPSTSRRRQSDVAETSFASSSSSSRLKRRFEDLIPSSSPAESPVAERTYSRPQSRASHEGPTSPSTSRRRQSDVAETSFASSSSSSRLKRRFEDHFDDDDSERYVHRASLHEELTAASDSGSEFDPEFPSMVAVSSIDPRAAARAAAILKMHHHWVENGIMPDGSRVGTPGPQERSRARSIGALETPQTTRPRGAHETPHSRFFDSIESSRLISKEELLHEAELELVGTSKSRPGTPFAADSPMRHIPGAWAATPRGRTPKRKRDSDEHTEGEPQPTLETPFQPHPRYDSSTYEGNVDGRSWTKRDWKYLEKTFKYLASKAEGPGVNFEAVVDAFLKQTGKEPVGEWSREVLLMRVRALARRHGKTEATEDREPKRQKTTTPANPPPSTLRKVMGWLWRGNTQPQETAEPAAATTSVAKPKKQRRDNDFLQTRDDSFEIGEVTMAATPSRPQDRRHASPPFEREEAYDAERSFEVDLERGHQSYDIPYEEEEEDEEEFFPEPTTYTARGERSSPEDLPRSAEPQLPQSAALASVLH